MYALWIILSTQLIILADLLKLRNAPKKWTFTLEVIGSAGAVFSVVVCLWSMVSY